MGVSTIGRGDVCGGPVGGGNIDPASTKYYSPIYRNLSDIGAVSGGGVAIGSAVGQEVVGSGRIGIGESLCGGQVVGGIGADGKVRRWRGSN